jgi:predicted Zn-dependent peptidase
MQTYQSAKLDNGMTVLMETMGGVRSVALGYWVRVGSRDEAPAHSGISHFLEHMFFKGTSSLNAEQIAVETDSLGGEVNAFTSKEGTTFYVKVMDEYLDRGIELLSDMFVNSTFPEDEIAREQGVVVEEIRMVEDTPDDIVHDLFAALAWGEGGLGRPVLGTEATVSALDRDALVGHVSRHYTADDVIVSCAGNFEPGALMDTLNRHLSRVPHSTGEPAPRLARFSPGVSVWTKPLSEAHLCLGMPGIAQASPDRYAVLLANTVLGGGTSSRLFQRIREKEGLAYSVFSFLNSYSDTGLWGVYAGTGKDKINRVIELAREEIRALESSITEEELERAKVQLKSSIVFGLESSYRRMQNIANQQMYYGRHFTPDEVIAAIDAVDLGRAREVCARYLGSADLAVGVLGPLEASDVSLSNG